MIIERDVAIPADDGLILRADVFRPDDGKPAPVLMCLGPYGKGVEYKTGYKAAWDWLFEDHPDASKLLPGSKRKYMTWESPDPEIWTEQWEYICIRVDSRGSGRTPGKLDIFSPREIKDYYDAIEWAGTQSWSNGKVGLLGISYYGMTQWLVAALQPPHLTAMIPWEAAADHYRDMLRHGGIMSNTFYESWYKAQVISNQHGNPNGWHDPWLGELATGPETLTEAELLANRTNSLQESLQRPLDGQYYRDRSAKWSRVTVPFLSAANWGGASLHSRGNYEAFTRAASSQKWLEVHGGRHEEAFYSDEGMALQKRFFDHFLKGFNVGWEEQPKVSLQIRRPDKPLREFGAEQAWPLPGTRWTKYYLEAGGSSLATTASSSESQSAFTAGSEELVFRSQPLPEETEITGPLAAKLFISSSTTDADLFLTLQAWSPEGQEVEFQGAWDPHTVLAQGWIRASHRRLDPELSTPWRPYHSHDKIEELVPGEVYEVDVEIWPTGIILPAGYTFSLRIAGSDFQRPEALQDKSLEWNQKGSGPFLHNYERDRGSKVYKGRPTVYTGGDRGSYLLVPVIGKS